MESENKLLIEKFYSSFAKSDIEGMLECYHPEIQFQDPAFGLLKGEEAKSMWRMLIERGKGDIKISFDQVKADALKGSANWVAEYLFSQTNRRVVNKISAVFEFKDGKIFRHTDTFDMWKWSSQALGMTGSLLGWSSFLKNKVRKTAKTSLQKYMELKK